MGMTKASRGKWTCQGRCRTQKPIAQFQPWKNITGQLKAYGCPRCDACIDMWPCRGGCQSHKHVAHFHLWKSRTGRSEPTRATRCDACMFVEAEKAKTKKGKLMVDIFCPGCSEPKTIDMEMFWEDEGRSRFKNERCLSKVCKQKVYKIGRWLRMRHDADATIRAWLDQNSCLQDSARPARMTLDLYCTQPKDAVVAPISLLGASLEQKGPWARRRTQLLRSDLCTYHIKRSDNYYIKRSDGCNEP